MPRVGAGVLDAAFVHLYGIDRDDVDKIMETFPIVKRKDIAARGSYFTKEAILKIYGNAMAALKAAGISSPHRAAPGSGPQRPPHHPLKRS